MVCSHPFFYVNTAGSHFHLFQTFWLRAALYFCLTEILFEMLKKSNFLSNFLRVVMKTVFRSNILFLRCRYLFSLIVEETCSIWLNNNLCAVIKKYSTRIIWKNVTKAVFAWIVNPFLNPYCLWMCILSSLHFFIRAILSISWYNKCTRRNCVLISTYWSLIVRTRSFQFHNLVTTASCNLHFG